LGYAERTGGHGTAGADRNAGAEREWSDAGWLNDDVQTKLQWNRAGIEVPANRSNLVAFDSDEVCALVGSCHLPLKREKFVIAAHDIAHGEVQIRKGTPKTLGILCNCRTRYAFSGDWILICSIGMERLNDGIGVALQRTPRATVE